ncbi:MAG TPA: hypothetical protein VMZ06_14485 [Candidatus Bathyarchaeia archaeon]|nr:hypothetical protein [Candidatus Bathyarchaeia archaeon]
MKHTILLVGPIIILSCAVALGADGTAALRAATFDVDATPPVGTQLAYDEMVASWDLSLRARGIVLLGSGAPIVLCAIDWINIANEGHDAFRKALARAAGTTPDRVAVHTLHQHDAPACDFSTEQILRDNDLGLNRYDGAFAHELIGRLERAVAASLEKAQPVTQVGLGKAAVSEVASNRRILGPDGKVRAMRFTACADPQLRAEPEGVIDPEVSVVSLWDGEAPVAVLSYYATHPQSYYRTGIANPDFPGVARFLRDLAVPSALHIYFTGAGGNVGAGKYNDGSKENRMLLAERLADGLRRAWDATVKTAVTAADVSWHVERVMLPAARHLSAERIEAEFKERKEPDQLSGKASDLAWLCRCAEGRGIDASCLALGNARILHMPGELFVEYQLAAKSARPGVFVAMAAYGDGGPGYIGTAKAYEEGGYETSERASNVAPEVETVLMDAIRRLLQD